MKNVSMYLAVFILTTTFAPIARAQEKASDLPKGFVLNEGNKSQFTIALPEGWTVFDQMKAFTGKSSEDGMMIFTSKSPEGLKIEEQLEVMAQMDTGKLPSFFVDRSKTIKGMNCDTVPEKAQTEIVKRVKSGLTKAKIVSQDVRVAPVGGCQAVLVRMEGQQKDGDAWVADVVAVSDGNLLYMFSLRNLKTNFEQNLEVYEMAMATLKLNKTK